MIDPGRENGYILKEESLISPRFLRGAVQHTPRRVTTTPCVRRGIFLP